ncbi:class C beta-lactamase-related serine hydrolase [Rhodovarius crocodyli]|uniref:Class C beta-lactamase-related serine hydrolase n=1 Tax=Rhodovarius crocodyli TaxID=1979269 RepID=A0A437MLV4_9PROT|nr:serine hydrolase [Rhodovarius crocodyli]RVT98586.1 class C beta-lactamase-related serine hydrolase [Rhodovarius crocodyli]
MTTITDALDFIAAHETPWPRDLRAHLDSGFFDPPPDNTPVGPVHPRGPVNAIITRKGEVLGTTGNTKQVDQTFSVAKSYLSMLTGIAVGDGLIADIDRPVRELVQDGGFESPQNATITWRHLLTNTSEWEGELFGKSDLIDRGRTLSREGSGPKRSTRQLQPPGSYWEYNDVRVNRLSLSLLRVFRRPLPEVWAERVMNPIGASTTWKWEGYDTAWVEVDGKRMQSVPGGTHWGGGVSISAEDQLRVVQMAANGGVWEGKRILPEGWVKDSITPCALNPHYGYLYWLNTGRTKWPAASEGAFSFSGAGGATCWVEPAEDLVCVFRWLDPQHLNEAMRLVREAVA